MSASHHTRRAAAWALQCGLNGRQTGCGRYEAGLECPLLPVDAPIGSFLYQNHAEPAKACMHDRLFVAQGVVPLRLVSMKTNVRQLSSNDAGTWLPTAR